MDGYLEGIMPRRRSNRSMTTFSLAKFGTKATPFLLFYRYSDPECAEELDPTVGFF